MTAEARNRSSAEDKAKAERLERLARRAYKAKDWKEAVAAFEAAFSADPLPKYLYNAARCHDRAGDFRTAIKMLKRYVAIETDPKERSGAEDRLTILQIRLDKTNWPELTVNTTPQGATIRLDSASAQPLGVSPVTAQVEPGPHRLFAAMPGHTQEFLDIEVVRGTPQAASLPLKESAGSGQAELAIRPAGATVTLNGEVIGSPPFAEPLHLPEGSHWVVVEAPAHRPWTGTLLIAKGKVARLVVGLEPIVDPGEGYRRAAIWAGGIAGGALLGGLAFGAAANSLHDDLAEAKSNGGGLPSSDDVGRGELYVALQTGLLVTGAAAAVFAGVMALQGLRADDDDPEEPGTDAAGGDTPGLPASTGVMVVPLAGPGLVGLGFGGAL